MESYSNQIFNFFDMKTWVLRDAVCDDITGGGFGNEREKR